MRKEYIAYDASIGHPAGEEYFYECTLCGGLVSAQPVPEYEDCACGNVHKEPGRLGTRMGDKGMRLVRIIGATPN